MMSLFIDDELGLMINKCGVRNHLFYHTGEMTAVCVTSPGMFCLLLSSGHGTISLEVTVFTLAVTLVKLGPHVSS